MRGNDFPGVVFDMAQKRKKKNDQNLGPIRAVGYVRVSTAKQADKGVSLEAQEERIRMYASVHGIELLRIEVDAGESASSLERPGLQRVLAALDTFEATAVIVVKLDRLTRNIRHFCALVDAYFRDGSCYLMAVNEQVDTSNAMGRMVLHILMSISEWERESAIERTAAVMQHLKNTGCYTGGWPPYGWAVDDEGALVSVPEEQAIMTQARAFKQAGLSLRAVAAALPANPRTGKAFNHKQIVRMM